MVRLRKHARVLILPVLAVMAIALAAGFFVGTFDQLWQNLLALFGALVLAVLLFLLPFFAWLGNTSTITTKRIIIRRGMLTRTRSEVPLNRVREIRTRASLWQRIFKTGNIELVTGQDAPLGLVSVPSMNGVVDMLHELLEANYIADSSQGSTTATAPATGPAHAESNATAVCTETEAF